MRSETSSQGNTEFLAEAQHLARVHHKNLVSLIGYCKDKKHLSLIYEYMDEGNLEDRLRGQEPLNWLQRLKIALDSAHGLEYLHKSCSPPLIHRDVKTGNILLTTNLQAKLSDFGLTRAFSNEMVTHMTTRPAGTLGYLDPEYYATSHLSEKSDVYSFGVVLLVLITGQRAIITISDTERNNITIWAHGAGPANDDGGRGGDQRELAARDLVAIHEVQLEWEGGSALADGEPVGALETELIGETSAR
ncbi:unnamed protein product [Triticum turgidum subsp. durum]|uniref:Protein kinase domain-containing protein n=1 Tax=Triticum turgidum subsp. durum TaxID=4567 RepID=A0A9R0WAF7_TRITD|nr:unnamed protein product [Triticum turgidum subsp. durum]